MTIGELLEELEKHPKDMKVFIPLRGTGSIWAYGLDEISEARIRDLEYSEYKRSYITESQFQYAAKQKQDYINWHKEKVVLLK